MNLPVAAGIFGLIVSIIYLFNAMRVLRTSGMGHTHNAAMIHAGMAGIFLPACLLIIFAYMP
ncbi:hypothetical protein [Erythrobacter sp. YT30]|uniref:hypothetical protein n=1 Tax=Erythrobacter sp. YT30 TaxID=1735012 RepID=UPI00076DBC28|nr:hypothetical protein [Erythrobacter sp. YT30]KWV91617.1 hypothetical protein AUC45_10375 [Erythrobacter sp. YT30]